MKFNNAKLTMTTEPKTTTTRIGGPLLGSRIANAQQQFELDPSSWWTMEPLVFSLGDEQFILLPNVHFITVMAYATGKQIASLVPSRDGEFEGVTITSLTLATFLNRRPNLEDMLGRATNDAGDEKIGNDDEKVLLVGCHDGTIREFLLSDVTSIKVSSSRKSCGNYNLPGRCLYPRRVIGLTHAHTIKHLSAPSMAMGGGVVLYAIIETYAEGTSIHQKLCRVVLPPFLGEPMPRKTNLSDQLLTIEKYKCVVGRSERKKKYENTVPFRLLMITRKTVKEFPDDGRMDSDLLVVVARSSGLRFYHERIVVADGKVHGTRSSPLAFDTPAQLSAVAVSPNGNDIASGFWEGDVRIFKDACSSVLDYFARTEQGEKPKHPSQTMLVRRVHWHAHPVTTLSYQPSGSSESLLYSGGEESVLVVWQLSRGVLKPADTLPRLAKGGITHVVAVGESSLPGILVCCDDNSLQLVQAHSLNRVWKVQCLSPCTKFAMMHSHEKSILISGLCGAPGFLNWFNPRSHLVDAQLEVVPFNRVSRTEKGDVSIPTPMVTHTAFSYDMTQMITVETVPTENPAIGATQLIKHGTKIGVVTTIKFWAKTPNSNNDPSKPYFTTASMTFPHGERHRISAISMSRNGEYACTVSNDEKAFRLWRQTLEFDEDDFSRRRPVWTCQYKVSTPSGYAKWNTPRQGVDFSSDGSTLCIAYGHTLTLWDHREATLLNSLRHISNDLIEQVQFVNTDLVHDFLLTRSNSGIQLQSPYGNGNRSMNWSTGILNASGSAAIISDVQVINGEQLSITTYFLSNNLSKILFVNSTTGQPTWPGLVIEVPCKVQGVIHANPWFQPRIGLEKLRNENEEPPMCIIVLSTNGELFLIQQGEDESLLLGSMLNPTERPKNAVPMIPMPPTRKRALYNNSVQVNDEPPIKMSTIRAFIGDDDVVPMNSTALPFISGKFMHSFVGRSLVKRDEEGS